MNNENDNFWLHQKLSAGRRTCRDKKESRKIATHKSSKSLFFILFLWSKFTSKIPSINLYSQMYHLIFSLRQFIRNISGFAEIFRSWPKYFDKYRNVKLYIIWFIFTIKLVLFKILSMTKIFRPWLKYFDNYRNVKLHKTK